MEPDSPPPIPASEPVSPEQGEFEQLRQGFHQRLQREQARLTTLTAALQSVHIDLAVVVSDIGVFAHKLRGAALVFEYQGIGAAAKALELAAEGAAQDDDGNPDSRSIVSAMHGLAMELVEQAPGSALPEPVLAESGSK
jgi:hypothetical protein